VLFIYPRAKFFMELLSNPLGLLSIATFLKLYNHTVRIYESGISKEKFKDVLKEFSPDIVGVSVMSGKAVDDATALSKKVKSAGIPVVWGGYLPTAMPELTLKTGCVDYISIGEGEYTWRDLLDSLETGKSFELVAGLAYMKDGQFIKTPERDFVDLAELPRLDFELIDIEQYISPLHYSKRTLSLYSSKGCIGHCTFCYNAFFNKGKHRVRPPEQVVEEISYLANRYNIDGIHFYDDLIFCNKDELNRFCNAYRERNLNVYWGSSSIIGLHDKEDFHIMYQAGCRMLMFGVESGSPKMLECVKKSIDLEKVKQVCSDCENTGIKVRITFIIGLPEETEEDLKKTVSLALSLKTAQVAINYYSIVPASGSYMQLISKGKLKKPDKLDSFIRNNAFDKLNNISNVPTKHLKVIYSYFVFRRYFNKNDDQTSPSSSWFKITIFALLKILRSASLSRTYSYFNRFVSILFYNFCYPKIRKKYGLYKNLR
jgi:anaerobic magnesium-protoporphyrin IX monomethyl ester cyclase